MFLRSLGYTFSFEKEKVGRKRSIMVSVKERLIGEVAREDACVHLFGLMLLVRVKWRGLI